MRIAFITLEYPPVIFGGAGTYAQNITRKLAELGHEVVVFSPIISAIDEGFECQRNLKFNYVKVNKNLPLKALQFWLHLPEEIRKAEIKDKFDILHFNGICYWFIKKKISEAKHVITIHHIVRDLSTNSNCCFSSRILNLGREESFVVPLLEKRSIECSDLVISVSNFTKNQILDYYKTDSNKVHVVYNGIDLRKFNFSREELEGTRNQLNIRKKPVILFVGRVNDPRKGLKFLLKAFKNVLEKTDATLVIVGKGDQTEARSLSDSLNISQNLIFTGFVDERQLKMCYLLCDIYVCPSKLEGFGLTLVEAMVAGKPIIATRVGAIPEIIGDYGILVNPEDEIELSNAILNVIHNSANMSCRSKFEVINKFSWDKAADTLTSIYEDIY
jgi:glycosyltransferase involved in cell wall biosynthesis